MAEGNGLDLGSLYGLLVKIGEAVSRQDVMLLSLHDEVRQIKTEMAVVQAGVVELKSRVGDLKADVGELKRTVATYHASVVGQGIITSEVEARVSRVGQHLGLPPFVHG